jgi:biopolymer transport protein ExbB
MDVWRFALAHDWPVLSPILLCSIIALAITVERILFYRRNRSGASEFIAQFQDEMGHGLARAKRFAAQETGIIGRLASQGITIAEENSDRFEAFFEVTASLAGRHLTRGLTTLGTIATICPYLGLFGTVVRILLTFGEMAASGGGGSSASIMFGIGSALIATALGLAVAIFAVAMNNYLLSVTDEFMKDFELIKLICMSATPGGSSTGSALAQRAWSNEGIQI